jgi:hypothetical protein
MHYKLKARKMELENVLLWTGYKQVENYKTRQVLLIHQLVLVS